MVCMWKRTSRSIYTQALEFRQERRKFAAGLHHWANEKKRRSLHPQRKKIMGHLGSLSYICENTRRGTHKNLSKKKIKVDGMGADKTRAIAEIQKRSDEKNDSTKDDLATFQKNIENAARKVVHRTKAQKRKIKNDYSRECQIA